VERAEARTADNARFFLQVAFNYGGRADIVDAARKFASAVEEGRARVGDLNEAMFEAHLSTAPAPAPDLIIRTSGEQRISNFLLWECAYAELVFQDVYWPDYGPDNLKAAVADFPFAGAAIWRRRGPMTFLPPVRRFDWDNFGVRAASGAILAAVALWAVWVFDGPAPLWRAPFLILISVAGALLSIEWAAMVTSRHSARAAVVTTLAVVTVTLVAFTHRYGEAWGCVVLGALAAGAVARGASRRAIDAAYGVFYIAPACLVIVWLRDTMQGLGWILMLFATTWAPISPPLW